MRLIGLPQNAPPPLCAKVKLVSSSESREQGHPLCDVRSCDLGDKSHHAILVKGVCWR